MKSFINNFFRKPPIIFPLVACFLLFLTINEVQLFLLAPDIDGVYKLRPLVMVLLTVFWIGATYFHKWAALGFLFVSLLMAAVYYFLTGSVLRFVIGDILMLRLPYEGNIIPIPFSIIFSFILLYYYRLMK